MDSDWIVRIEYKNQDMETVVVKEYPFLQYLEMVASGITSVITDVENVFYEMENGEQKENWSKEHVQKFKAIRHKLLDHANSVRRLNITLFHNGENPTTLRASEYFARVIDEL